MLTPPSSPLGKETTEPDPAPPISIPEMARRLDKPAWMVARGVARLIAAGLLQVADGTPVDAVADLRRRYGDAVNG